MLLIGLQIRVGSEPTGGHEKPPRTVHLGFGWAGVLTKTLGIAGSAAHHCT